MDRNLGKITKENDGYKVAFERILNHPITVVWEAISNPEQLKIWFTDFEMKLQPGSPIKIYFRDEAKTVTTGKVIEIDPPHKFVWTWEGELAVWKLTSLNETQTRLLFTYSKLTDQYALGASVGFHSLLDRLENKLNGSKETYPFGTEELSPEDLRLKEEYGKFVFDLYPELEAHSPVILKKTFPVSALTLWKALTDNEQLRQWYFDFNGNFKAEAGHVFEWSAGPPGGKTWLHQGKILEVQPFKKLIHSWKYPGYEGEAKLTWQLIPQGEHSTLLKLQFDFVQPFDFREEALRRKNFAQGWQEIVNKMLPGFLNEKQTSEI